LFCFAAFRFGFLHETADRLGWIFEGRVIFIHQCLCDHCDHFLFDAALIQDILQVLL
jgi:hypothetical protein